MYLKLNFKNYGEIPIYISDEKYANILSKFLPLESTAMLWKEEYYFETPVDYHGETTLKVKSGNVAYWPPGKAFCLFYGFNQPYSPVIIIGEIIGPLYHLKELAKEEINVKLEKIVDEDHIADFLRNEGFKSARRYWIDASSVAVNVEVDHLKDFLPTRIGFDIYVEDYGYSIESDGILFYEDSLVGLKIKKLFENLVKRQKISRNILNKIRIDINEDYYICLSSFTTDLKELSAVLKTMAKLYIQILDYLEVLL